MKDLAHILLAEDDEFDADLTIKALTSEKIANPIDWIKDGQEALDYLTYKGAYADRKRQNPIFVLLDLKMPKLDGIEVLHAIRNNEELKKQPVILLTSSKEEKDVVKAYNLNVNAYVVKPINFIQFNEAIRQIGAFWVLYNEPPPDK